MVCHWIVQRGLPQINKFHLYAYVQLVQYTVLMDLPMMIVLLLKIPGSFDYIDRQQMPHKKYIKK